MQNLGVKNAKFRCKKCKNLGVKNAKFRCKKCKIFGIYKISVKKCQKILVYKQYPLLVIMLGDSNAGKTSIVQRYTRDEFTNTEPTIDIR